MVIKPQAKTQGARSSWRDVLPIHPAAELFPLMSADELRELGEDIKKNGLTSTIILWSPDGRGPSSLLDGRNRLDAMELVGIKVTSQLEYGVRNSAWRFLNLSGKDVDPYAYVISANIHRRHLTADDKRRIIAALLKANPQKSDRQIAKLVDASPTTVGDERKKTSRLGHVDRYQGPPATAPKARDGCADARAEGRQDGHAEEEEERGRQGDRAPCCERPHPKHRQGRFHHADHADHADRRRDLWRAGRRMARRVHR
jgi:hypothetical protein